MIRLSSFSTLVCAALLTSATYLVAPNLHAQGGAGGTGGVGTSGSTGGAGGGSLCDEACDRIDGCSFAGACALAAGQAGFDLSTCDAEGECVSQCILDASCMQITSLISTPDPVLSGCIQTCLNGGMGGNSSTTATTATTATTTSGSGGAPTTTTSGSGGMGGANASTGSGNGDDALLVDDGCGCRTAGRTQDHAGFALYLLGVAGLWRRQRRRSGMLRSKP